MDEGSGAEHQEAWDRLARDAADAWAAAAGSAARVDVLLAELRVREERLRLALEASGAGCWDFDPVTLTYVWDDRCRALFGLDPGAPVDRAVVDGLVHPEDRGVVEAGRRAAVEPEDRSFRFDFRVVRPSGEVGWLRAHGRPVIGPEGGVIRLVGTLTEVTAERDAQREKEKRDRWRDLMLGVLGHDLRSPLTAIRLSAQLLERGALSGADRGHVRRLLVASDRMRLMIAQLLDMTRLKLSGAIPLQRRSIELGALCRAVVEETAGDRPGAVTVEGDAEVTADADPDRLFQVVANLVQNALVHGDGTARVRVRAEGDEWVVEVHNGGAPIADDLLPVLFDPFVRGAGAHRSGLGLGLFISHRIAAAHGGTLDVVSSADGGTTFTLRLR